MSYVVAFAVGGAICAAAQIVLTLTRLTPAHVLAALTVIGAALEGLGLYGPMLRAARAGILIPVVGFGASVARGAVLEYSRQGLVGLFSGAFEFVGLGVACAVVFGFAVALVARPRD